MHAFMFIYVPVHLYIATRIGRWLASSAATPRLTLHTPVFYWGRGTFGREAYFEVADTLMMYQFPQRSTTVAPTKNHLTLQTTAWLVRAM